MCIWGMPFFKGCKGYILGHALFLKGHTHNMDKSVYSIDEIRIQTDDGTHVQIQDGRIQPDDQLVQIHVRQIRHENVPFV